MKKLLLLAILILSLSLTLAACGGDTGDGQTPGSGDPTITDPDDGKTPTTPDDDKAPSGDENGSELPKPDDGNTQNPDTGHTHSFNEWTTTKAPTCTDDGIKTRTCTCGEVETKSIAALGHDYTSVVCSRCQEKLYETVVETWDISATESDNVVATLYNDKGNEGYYVLVISGSGNMKDWSSNSSAPWYSYRTKIKSLIIEYHVTSIGDRAFSSCYSLTSVSIGNSVTSIGDDAFYHCDSLTSIKYRGTEAQWNAISKGSGWDSYTGNYTITYNYEG